MAVSAALGFWAAMLATGAGGASGTTSAPPASTAAAAPPLATVTVLVCPEEFAADPGLTNEMMRPLAPEIAALRTQGIVVSPTYVEEHCRAIRSGQSMSGPPPDLVLAISVASEQTIETSRALLTFRIDGHDVVLQVLGRALTGSFASKALRIPEIAWSDRKTGGDGADANAAAGTALWPDLVAGLAGALAYRKVSARGKLPDDVRARADSMRQTAAATLARADRPWLSTQSPLTSVVVKQLRAMLLFDEPCPSESPRDLLDAAVRLAPYNAQSRLLAAIARLRDMFVPPFCAVVVRDELFRSLDLDPWSNEAVDDLGILYELALNARPETQISPGKVSVDEAADQLDRVWRQDAPPSPLALELGVGASLSSAADQSLLELGPGLRIDLAYGRDGSGWGVRLGLELPWARQRSFPVTNANGPVEGVRAWVGWTRPALDIGPRYRQRFGSFYGEIQPALLVAAVVATGHEFDTNYTASNLNVGGGGTLRLGRRLGRFSVWLGIAGSYFVGTSSVQLMALQTTQTATLPKVDLSVLAGASVLVWR